MSGAAARHWAESLAGWAIPPEILAAAPEEPWALPVGRFSAAARSVAAGNPSRTAALSALSGGGSALDVGCGGGAAGLAVAPPADHLTGVDTSPAMLEEWDRACAERGVAHSGVLGRWPDVAVEVGTVDVALCHHVVYNVADLTPFLEALTAHTRRLVVVELTDRHPTTDLSPLWRHFWGLERPDEPTADDFVAVAQEAGLSPTVVRWERPSPAADASLADVEFVRRRLCLGADRDAEIASLLPPARPPAPVATVSWAGQTR